MKVIVPRSDIVDWYSFTINTDAVEITNIYDSFGNIDELLEFVLPHFWQQLSLTSCPWSLSRARAPYQVAYKNEYGIVIYYSHAQDNCLIEVQGVGCEFLRTLGLLDHLMSKTYERATRVDVAVDLQTTLMPTEFVDAGYSKKFRSKSEIQSPSGETVYIGSRKSARYVRVYRYSSPHPREKFLRVEYVFRKEEAKTVAEKLCKNSVRQVANSCKQIYGWKHPIFEGDFGGLNLKAFEIERRDNNTVVWLMAVAAPAFIKLARTNVLADPKDFIERYFIEPLERL